MKKPEFDIYQVADVSTKYITKEDGSLIGRLDAPGHVARIDPGDAESGSSGSPGRSFAFSERFIASEFRTCVLMPGLAMLMAYQNSCGERGRCGWRRWPPHAWPAL